MVLKGIKLVMAARKRRSEERRREREVKFGEKLNRRIARNKLELRDAKLEYSKHAYKKKLQEIKPAITGRYVSNKVKKKLSEKTTKPDEYKRINF